MRTRALLIVPAVALAALGGWRALDGAQAGGASFTVDSVADAVDAAPGDGECATAAGECTLRAAIQESNALDGPDMIDVPAGAYALTATGADEDGGATGDLDILDDVKITGAGASETIIDGTAQDRVLDVAPQVAGISVAIAGLTIRNGDTLLGGGILNAGELTLRDVTVSGNHGAAGGGIVNNPGATLELDGVLIAENSAGTGGGMRNNGDVMATDSSISRNTSSDDGGAAVNYGTFIATGSHFDDNETGDNGGAFWGDGVIELSNGTLHGNTATDEGGAIVNFVSAEVTLTEMSVVGNRAMNLRGGALVNFGGSTMVIVDSTVSDNSAGGNGGGILNNGTMTLERSTISHNTSQQDGGGIHAGGATTITNVTVSGNTAANGGGVFNNGTLTATNVTVAANTSSGPGGGFAGGGTAVVTNTILADNSPDNCGSTVGSLGHNLDDGASCGFGQTTDVTNADALLGPLDDNGGETQTHALLPESPAVDGGDAVACPPTDQRGVARPQGARCDIGAFELGGAPVLAGDANCDGAVNSLDAAIVLQYAAGLIDALPCLEAADVNGDGRVDSIDAALILQYTAGLLDALPVGP